jgi:hypothetical protein
MNAGASLADCRRFFYWSYRKSALSWHRRDIPNDQIKICADLRGEAAAAISGLLQYAGHV